ncbi:MAG TPA: alpha/beta fold hydrolase [Ktedonobacteraceae bacterium]|nr:alpha/beta fold hydrolase [Ktedonobacteraceae bacterium]
MTEPEILAGAEPFYAENGNVGVLVAHGFTGNPQSMRYLAEGLASAGYTVALPRLRGHGTTAADMATSTASGWIADLEQASTWLQQRCDTLFVTGLSMGGTLTLFMAGQHPDLFKGIIPINAIVFSNNPDLASLAFMSPAPPEVPGVGNDIKAEGVTELAYPVVPVPTVKELFTLMKVADEMLPRIACPALIFVSRDDHVVPPVNAEYIFGKLPNPDKRLAWLENSYHVATLDNDKDLILQQSITFIREHS